MSSNENHNTRDEAPKSPGGLDLAWTLSSALIVGVAVFLRFYELGLKPFHHDEGVNGWFLTTLFREGVYRYDPANYHGPTLYYIALAFAKIFGLETVTVRASVAVFGVLIVVLALFLWRYIGKTGALFAALFLAVSPGMVFISRYFIHEIFFVFLGLGLVLSVVFFILKAKAGPWALVWAGVLILAAFSPPVFSIAASAGASDTAAYWSLAAFLFALEAVMIYFVIRILREWNGGRPLYLILASCCAALMFATKETAFITLGTMLIAVLCVRIWLGIYSRRTSSDAGRIDDEGLGWKAFREGLEAAGPALVALTAAAVFVFLGVLLFSSFFTYWEGVGKAFEAYAIWIKTGSKDHTQGGAFAYLKWAWEIEAPILLLSAAGVAIAIFKARHRFAIFVGLWAFGLFAAYSIIPYKTPWLALSFLLPMCISAGCAVNELTASRRYEVKAAGILAGLAAAAILAFQAWDLNFVRYDDESLPYVYAHTKREFLDLTAEIDRIAEKSGKGHDAAIDIVSPDYWPLVWYVRDYEKAVFHGRMIDRSQAEMIIAKQGEQDAAVSRRFLSRYEIVGYYPLRPGVDLVLLVRRDIGAP